MPPKDYKFEGWLAHDKNGVGGMTWGEYEPKPFEDDDVDIEIECCGVCGSDLHTLRAGWGPTDYPCCVGHEIVGRAIRVGSKAERGIKLGDRVGVGAQSRACRKSDCDACSKGLYNHCAQPGRTDTYDSKYPDGSKSYGGYANYWRGPSSFVLKIPEGVSSNVAAPLLCGGITVYAPLVENGAGPGKRVGIVGIGGIGHFGLLFAKALGCDEVVAISRSSVKKQEALELGATSFIATEEDEDWAQKNSRTLDIIVSTSSSANMPLGSYFTLLRTGGNFIQIGVPEENLPAFNIRPLIARGAKLSGSLIGTPDRIAEMLDLVAEKQFKPLIQARPMSEANQVVKDLEDGKARYRYVLVNEKHGGKVNGAQ